MLLLRAYAGPRAVRVGRLISYIMPSNTRIVAGCAVGTTKLMVLLLEKLGYLTENCHCHGLC